MKNVIRNVRRDIRENLPVILLFIAQCVSCVYFITALGMYFISNQELSQALKDVTNSDITAFSFRGDTSTLSLNEEIRTALRKTLSSNGNAYSIVSSGYLPSSDQPLLVGIGAFGSAFGMGLAQDLSLGDGPIALLGAGVDEWKPGEAVSVGQTSLSSVVIRERLPEGSLYLQGTDSVVLDKYVVLLVTFEQFEELYPYNVADVMVGYHMIGASNDQILAWISQMSAQPDFEMRPYSLSDKAMSSYTETSSYLRFYLGVYGCSLLFIVIGLGIFLNRMIDRNMREYAIHRLYGATLFQILARIMIYVAAITAIPLFAYPAYVNDRAFESTVPIQLIALLYIMFHIGLSTGAIWRLEKNGMIGMTRRDF